VEAGWVPVAAIQGSVTDGSFSRFRTVGIAVPKN